MEILSYAGAQVTDRHERAVIYRNDRDHVYCLRGASFTFPLHLPSSPLHPSSSSLYLAFSSSSRPAIMAGELSPALSVISDTKYPLLVLVVGFFALQQWQSYRRLAQFKGPFWAGITNLWLARSVSRRRAHLDLFETFLQYGSSPRIPGS
jgi:hypothetical protein